MPRIAINVVRYNHAPKMLEECIRAALSQDISDYTCTLTENGSERSVRDHMELLFGSNPKFRYFDNGANLGFSGAHNTFFSRTDSEFLMPLNPDAIMTPGFLRTLLTAFEDSRVGACTGKMLKSGALADSARILDGTGIVVSRTRRGRERGQLEPDENQFDNLRQVFGVSGTAPMYRKSSLEQVRLFEQEYFDEDFFAYWEDLDLSWRLRLAGFNCVYVPEAIIYHSRSLGLTRQGYFLPTELAKHRRSFPISIRCQSWRNQIFTILKNDFGWTFWRDFPSIFALQVAIFLYIVMFEPRTLTALPKFFRLLPRMLQKRTLIQARRVVTSTTTRTWFGQTPVTKAIR